LGVADRSLPALRSRGGGVAVELVDSLRLLRRLPRPRAAVKETARAIVVGVGVLRVTSFIVLFCLALSGRSSSSSSLELPPLPPLLLLMAMLPLFPCILLMLACCKSMASVVPSCDVESLSSLRLLRPSLSASPSASPSLASSLSKSEQLPDMLKSEQLLHGLLDCEGASSLSLTSR